MENIPVCAGGFRFKKSCSKQMLKYTTAVLRNTKSLPGGAERLFC